ncbi:MAG: uL30 family ribosomal protein [Candidatus Pacearchaeota archaeon]|jgi:large subunit ribosomal protein L30
MIAIIRIAGMVNRNGDIEETLFRLKLRRKYACTLINETKENLGMIKKVRSFVAYGKIDKETLLELVKKRGQPVEKSKKIDAEKVVEHLIKNKNFENTGIKPFFRLHPARGGISSKQHFPKGVLGDHGDKINDLIRRML